MNKVSHVQFVEDLAAKLGLSEEETVKKLTELILSIKKESASGEMIIDGLGTFTTKGKILTFVPDESFELEINHNYAGMMPVVIEEPKPGTAASSAETQNEDDEIEESDAVTDDFEEEEFVHVIDEQDPFDLDDDETGTESTSSSKSTGEKSGDDTSDAAEKARKAALEAEEQKIKEEEDTVSKAELEAQTEEKKKEKEVAAASATAAFAARKAGELEKARAEAEKVNELEKEAAEKKKAEAMERAEEAAEKSTEELTDSGADNEEKIRPKWAKPEAETIQDARADGKKPAIKEIPAYDRNRPESNTGTIVAILVAAVVVVAGALYLFVFLSGSEPSPATPPEITEQTELPPSATELPEIEETETGISSTEQLAQEEAARDVTAQPVPPVDDQTAAPPAETQQTLAPAPETAAPAASYGLRGTMNTSLARPYTIVVHSLASRTDAEREAAGFAGAGYRSTWFRVELPNGSVRWRVSIGQFASSEAAVEAARQLPEPYSANNFISRIESYNQ